MTFEAPDYYYKIEIWGKDSDGEFFKTLSETPTAGCYWRMSRLPDDLAHHLRFDSREEAFSKFCDVMGGRHNYAIDESFYNIYYILPESRRLAKAAVIVPYHRKRKRP